MATKNKTIENTQMSLEELSKTLFEKQKDLTDARRGNKAGELTNPRVITSLRKEVARLKTTINASKEEK
jgi:ribosomal protein L29